jgi:EAL domain-containing protein (putative c-di-GMP-specific phosphodiesterase class I)
MSNVSSNVILLVELASSEALIRQHSSNVYELILFPEFIERVKATLRTGDQSKTMGSNRCLLVLKDISTAEVQLAIRKLRSAFDTPVDALGEIILLQINIGTAYIDPQTKNVNDAVREAGLDLARSKQASLRPSPARKTDDPAMLLQRIKEALELGEFHLYFQPKFHAQFRSLMGAEALLRWHTKDKRVLVPANFLGVLKKDPLLLTLMDWVLKSAIARLRRWPKNLSIAINMPSSLIGSRELAATLSDALTIYDIEPKRIILEVSEEILIENPEDAALKLRGLKEIGVRICIGDFCRDHFRAYKALIDFIEISKSASAQSAAAQSSLHKGLPIDELKIDKRLIGNIRPRDVNTELIASVIELAHNAKMRVVGIGVEDEETARILATMGCDELQGFGLDTPLLIKEFERKYNIETRSQLAGGRKELRPKNT